MDRTLNRVVVDAVRTAFGRAGEKGVFWNTRAVAGYHGESIWKTTSAFQGVNQ